MSKLMAAMLRLPQVKIQLGYRASASIYGAINNGLFPKPILIGARAVAWPDTEVDAINRARIAGKSKDEIKALVIRLHEQRATACEANTAGVQQ
jgi:prophage regulatory protein